MESITAGAFFFLGLTSLVLSEGTIELTYTIENSLVEPQFQYTLKMEVPETWVFFHVMKQAETRDSHYSFQYTHHDLYGISIQAINELANDHTMSHYWMYRQRDKDGHDVAIDRGVSSYRPKQGDHIVWIYKKYVPGEHESPSEISLNYTIKNDLVEPRFEYTLQMENLNATGLRFFRVMELAQDEDSLFQFEYTSHAEYGNFITAINGLEQVPNKYYWLYYKPNYEGKETLINVGVSFYWPVDGDEILFKYTEYIPEDVGKVNIQYSIENDIANPKFRYDLNLTIEEDLVFFDIMKLAEKLDWNYRFLYSEDTTYGAFITAINGLKQHDDFYWLYYIIKKDNKLDLIDGGVSTFIPVDGDHIIFKYTEYEPDYDDGRGESSQIEITYSIENGVTQPEFEYSLEMEVEEGQDFFTIMKEAETQNGHFTFEYTWHAIYGAFITSINGLDQISLENYWTIYRTEEGGSQEQLDVGVSSYKPKNGDHVLWKYTEYTPSNHTSPAEISLTYTIRNVVVEPNFEYTLDMEKVNSSFRFFDVMELAEEENSRFQFEYTTHPDYGAFVTAINGLEQVANKYYWLYYKPNYEGKDTLINVGVSLYWPIDGDQILFNYTEYIPQDLIKIDYIIENTELEPNFRHNLTMDVDKGMIFFDVMKRAEMADWHFRFLFTDDPSHGKFITAINGLLQVSLSYYWLYYTRGEDGHDTLINKGVSSYVPQDGQIIVFKYEEYEPGDHEVLMCTQCEGIKFEEDTIAPERSAFTEACVSEPSDPSECTEPGDANVCRTETSEKRMFKINGAEVGGEGIMVRRSCARVEDPPPTQEESCTANVTITVEGLDEPTDGQVKVSRCDWVPITDWRPTTEEPTIDIVDKGSSVEGEFVFILALQFFAFCYPM